MSLAVHPPRRARVLLSMVGATCLASRALGACGSTTHDAASDGGAEGASSASHDGSPSSSSSGGGDACGGSLTEFAGVEPPPPPGGALSKPTMASHDYAISRLYRGDTDRKGTPSPDAWASFGYDLDGKVTTIASTDACTLTPGATPQAQVDGDCGRDNSWGANVMPIIVASEDNVGCPVSFSCIAASTDLMYVTGFDDTAGNTTSALGLTGVVLGGQTFGDPTTSPGFGPSAIWPVDPTTVSGCSATSGCPAGTNPVNGALARLPSAFQTKGQFVGGAPVDFALTIDMLGGSTLPLSIKHAIVTFSADRPGSVTNGTIAGVLLTRDLVATLRRLAGAISASLCTGSALEGLVAQFEQASDILYDGATISNVSGQACNAISIGLGFDATEIAPPSVIAPGAPQPPDPCGD